MTLEGTTKRVLFQDTSSGTPTNYIKSVTVIADSNNTEDPPYGQEFDEEGKFYNSLRNLIFASTGGKKRNCLTNNCGNRENMLGECSTYVQDFCRRHLSLDLSHLEHVHRERGTYKIVRRDNKSHESRVVLEMIGGECILSQRKHRESSKKSRSSWSAPLFIDRLKSNFQSQDFVPRIRAYRNWCPKFLSKYLRDNRQEREENFHKPLRKTLSRSFVPERPKIYSIGLQSKGSRSMDDNSGICNAIRNLKRCLNSVRRYDKTLLFNRNTLRKEWVRPSLSSSVSSIPIYCRKHCPYQRSNDFSSKQNDSREKLSLSVQCNMLEYSSEQNYHDYVSSQNSKSRKHYHRHSQHHRHNKSRNEKQLRESFEIQNNHTEESMTKKSIAVQVSRRKRCKRSKKYNIRNADVDLRKKTDKLISKEIISEKVKAVGSDSSNGNDLKLIKVTRTAYDPFETKYFLSSLHRITTAESVANKTKDRQRDRNLMTARPTGSEYLTIAESPSYTRILEAKVAEIEILGGIKRRIDKDFDICPLSGQNSDDLENFVISRHPRNSVVSIQGSSDKNEIENKDRDTYSLSKEEEESEEFVSCRSSPCKIDSAMCTYIDDSAPLVISSIVPHYKTTETEVRACFSSSTIIEYSQKKSCDSKYLLLKQLYSLNAIPQKLNINSSVKHGDEDSTDNLALNNAKFRMTTQEIKPVSDERERIPVSKLKNVIDFTDSGVLTDCWPNELYGSQSSVPKKIDTKKNDRHCSIYKREADASPVFDFNSDSCSDGSLERRVDRAVKAFTENLVFCERRAKTKLKMLRKRRRATLKIDNTRQMNSSRTRHDPFHDYSRLCHDQWSSEDEKISSFSTPSLSPFSDSEIENSPSSARSKRVAFAIGSSRL